MRFKFLFTQSFHRKFELLLKWWETDVTIKCLFLWFCFIVLWRLMSDEGAETQTESPNIWLLFLFYFNQLLQNDIPPPRFIKNFFKIVRNKKLVHLVCVMIKKSCLMSLFSLSKFTKQTKNGHPDILNHCKLFWEMCPFVDLSIGGTKSNFSSLICNNNFR